EQRNGEDAAADAEEGGEDPRRNADGDEAHATYRTSMASRVGLLAILVVAFGVVGASSAARQPPTGTAMYVVRHDQRLCPSPLCGGYWVAIANGARTRCQDGMRHPRCYVARAVDPESNPTVDIVEGALVRGVIDFGRDDLGELVVTAVYAPAGTAALSGGYYRVGDNGIRCVRAPCFSYRVTQVNGSTRTTASGVDLAASGATTGDIARGQRALHSKDGLYARGRFTRTPDGGRVFRALRLYLKAPQPRA
ncbi:MAG: DUF6748 domain-containing protein, partial [Gaiellaceae bacterium]